MNNEIKNIPLVSIGIPTYNRANKIGSTIKSILKQDYNNLEILISNNASEDNTRQVCQKIQKEDKRIKYFEQQTNIGAYANYDFLAEKSSGKYFMWICDDDKLNEGVLSRYVDFLEKNQDFSLVSGQIQNWRNGRLKYVEKGLSQESNIRLFRVLGYYSKVKEGAMIYGLIRKSELSDIKMLKNKIGSDWHLVAHLSYKAKIKQLNFVSYIKQLDGFSGNWAKYAKTVNASKIAGMYPFIIMGIDTFKDIYTNSEIYKNENKFGRFIIGIASCISIWITFYLKTYPIIIGGRIKRNFFKTTATKGKPI